MDLGSVERDLERHLLAGRTPVLVVVNDTVRGAIVLADAIKPGAKEAVTALEHVEDMFAGKEREVRLTGLNPPQTDPNGRQFVLFTLECAYPETVR